MVKTTDIADEARNLIPESIARDYGVVPLALSRDKTELLLAAATPRSDAQKKLLEDVVKGKITVVTDIDEYLTLAGDREKWSLLPLKSAVKDILSNISQAWDVVYWVPSGEHTRFGPL